MKTTFKISIVLFIILFDACKKDKPTPPVLTTTVVTEISYTSATSGGSVINEGGSPVMSMGICWDTAAKPTIERSTYEINGSTSPFTGNLTGLTPNTLYYVRAFATNKDGTGYGEQVAFKTINTEIPEVVTTSVLEISGTSAVSGGNITDDNGSEVIVRGICWATTANPTINDSKTTNASGGKGIFSGILSGLTEGTIYHVRAYATNSVGTNYGLDYTFTTLSKPVLTTAVTSDISFISAATGGNISFDGGAPVSARGVCWNTSQTPTLNDNKTIDGSGTGDFISNINGLTVNTTYYARAYATNSVGTAYGNVVSFKTKSNETDIDGNLYNVISIGSQVWMAENLKVTHTNDGTNIPLVSDYFGWSILTSPGYCWYNNDALTHKDAYGAMYNCYAVSTGKICPVGWHVPTDNEWTTLTTYLGGLSVAGGKMKETGTSHWNNPNADATNESKFTALPGGYRSYGDGAFFSIGDNATWWSSTSNTNTTAWTRAITLYNTSDVQVISNDKRYGISVRCIMD